MTYNIEEFTKAFSYTILETYKEFEEFLDKQKEKIKAELSDIKDKLDKSFTFNIIFQLKNGSERIIIPTNSYALNYYLLLYSVDVEAAERSSYAKTLRETYIGAKDVEDINYYDIIKQLLYCYDLKYIIFNSDKCLFNRNIEYRIGDIAISYDQI